MHVTMTGLYLIPSFIASIFLFSIAIYLSLRKPRRKYIIPLISFCFAALTWNMGVMLTNVTNGSILWARISALGLIFIPPIIFHFAVEYTNFFEDKYYLLAYVPAFLLVFSLPMGYYVTGVNRDLAYGIEPTYEFLLFSLNSWIGFFLVLFSIFILFKYYRESVGIKKRQTLIILFAIPTNAFLSFITYEIMVEMLGIAQFPVGALLDLIMVALIVYAILRFKLPVGTAAEIDFRILAETASDGICIIDKEGDIEYSNKHFCEMVNLPKKKVLGSPFKHFVSSEFYDKFNDIIRKTLKGEKIFGMEIVLEKEGDGTVVTEMNTSPIIWDDRIIGSFITIRNIEERKRAEEALKESEEKYRTLVENLNVGVYRNTPGEKGKFLEVNSALIRMFGYESKDEFLKLNVSDLYYYPEERKKFNEKMLREGFVKNEEIQLKRKDGSLMWGSVTAKAVRDEQGNVKYYDGIIEDITDRKKAEEELIKQKTYFQALFESSPEAIVSLDEKHHVLDLNPTFVKLFGYTLEELKGRDLDDFVLPEDEKEIGKELTEKVLKGEIVRSEGLRKRKDGSLIPVSILGAPIFIEGKQVGIYTIYRDITARKEAEQEREFYDSLLRHDVANRNTIIQGSLELLSEEDLTEEQKSIVKNALKAAHSSSELIEMIRNLRHIGGEQSLVPINLHEVLSKVVSILEQQAKNKGIEIVYSPIEGVVKADSLIENAFSNIIQNAIIHSNCNKIIISGKEEERGGKTFYKISIEDDGKGIPDDIRKNIFSLGVKSKGSPGSGLGLYLVKKIIESYGGNIVIRKSEKGTIFDVYVPKFK